MPNVWITEHALVDGDANYLVCAIGQRPDKSTYLYDPHILKGWQFKQRLSGCYAGILMPEWIQPERIPDVQEQEA